VDNIVDNIVENAEDEIQENKKPAPLPPKPKRSFGGLVLILLLIVLLGGVAYWRFLMPTAQMEPLPAQPVQVYVATAQISSISVNTTLTGRVRAADEAAVFAAGGEVRRINVEVGDYVKKGQRLFSLDATQVQGGYSQAQIARDMAQEGVNTARQNLERMQSLYQSAAIPLTQLEQAENMLATAQNQLRQAEAGLTNAANSLNLLNFDSPIAGYITEINIKEGMYPIQTMPAVAIADLDDLEIHASVSEYLIGYIQENAPASFKITSLTDTVYEGVIKTVALAPASGGLTYPITMAVNAPPEAGIMPGMFAEISLSSNHKEEALVIPAKAIMTRGGQTMVAVLTDDDIPLLREVQTGLDNSVMVEITAGLAVGETVITTGQHYIIEGEAVIRLTN